MPAGSRRLRKLTAGTSRSPASSTSKNSRWLEPEHAGDEHGGERLDRVVVGQHRVVVDLPGDRDLVLGVSAARLELRNSVRLQLRVRLGDREQPAERLAQEAFGLRRLGGVLRALRRGARLRDRLERAALVRRVALDGLDEVRDQVAPPPQLDVDLRPRVLDAVAQLDEPVVEHDERQQRQHDDDDDHDHGDHDRPP